VKAAAFLLVKLQNRRRVTALSLCILYSINYSLRPQRWWSLIKHSSCCIM